MHTTLLPTAMVPRTAALFQTSDEVSTVLALVTFAVGAALQIGPRPHPPIANCVAVFCYLAAAELLLALTLSAELLYRLALPLGALLFFAFVVLQLRRATAERQSGATTAASSDEPSRHSQPTVTAVPDSLVRKEVLLGRRAMRIGAEMQKVHSDLMHFYRIASMNRPPAEADRHYWSAVRSMRFRMGAKWDRLVADLAAHELIDAGYYRPVSDCANITGLDSDGEAIEAIGRDLLRRRGIDPDT